MGSSPISGTSLVMDDYEDFDDEMSTDEAEQAGYFDGVNDGMYGTWHQGYGLSVDEFELSEDARDAYENGYLNGYNSEHLDDQFS